MKTIFHRIRPLVLTGLLLAGCAASTLAQEVAIPDPGLNAAIRELLLKPTGPLTKEDLLRLNELDVCCRNVSTLQGLEAAGDLIALSLQSNHLANLTLPNGLTNLSFVDLSSNPLTNCVFPSGLTNLILLTLEVDALTNLTLPAGLSQLASLHLEGNRLASLTLPPDMTELIGLFVEDNPLTTLVLSETLATRLASTVAFLQHQGVAVFTYPLAV